MDSIWRLSFQRNEFPALKGTVDTDVCIVGAGIAGLLTAYRLLEHGRKVVIVERDQPGCGETLNTTAHISFILDRRLHEIEELHGKETTRLTVESHDHAIRWLNQVAQGGAIDCAFEYLDGYLFGESESLQAELETLQLAGVKGAALIEPPLKSFSGQGCLRVPQQAQFHPGLFIHGLARKIMQRGGAIYGATPAQHIERTNGRWRVSTDSNDTVAADIVVMAANSPVTFSPVIHLKQAAYRSYVVGMALAKDSIPHALYWDSEMPYHYVRSVNAPGMTYLLVGGEDHKTGQEEGRDGEGRFVALAKWAHDHFPDAGPPSIRWSGQLLEPLDGLAYIGATGERDCYVATGFSGNGMTYGAISGILIADLIEGKANPWSEIYDPTRSAMADLSEYVKSNVNSAAQYASWITPGDVSSIEEIPYGSGAVIRDGLRKIAVWRDRNGSTVQLSAVCTHMECIVTWNSAEETWDCPCHGSRFDAHGKVLCGPAVHDLEPEPVTEEKEA